MVAAHVESLPTAPITLWGMITALAEPLPGFKGQKLHLTLLCHALQGFEVLQACPQLYVKVGRGSTCPATIPEKQMKTASGSWSAISSPQRQLEIW